MAYSSLVTGGNCVSDRGCTCCVVGFFPRSSKFFDLFSLTLFTLCAFVVTKK